MLDEVADDKERSWPGDIGKGEIAILEPGAFDERGERVQMLLDRVEFPNGNRGTLPRVTRSPKAEDGVVIAPIDEDDRIVLVKQFRHPVRIWTWELPRGGSEPGQPPGGAVHAELIQEIGYQAIDAPFSLGRLIPDSGTLAEIPYLYAVRVRAHPRGAQPEGSEAIAGHTALPFEDLWDRCVRGLVNDAFTVGAVLRLYPHFRPGRFEIDQRFVHKYSRFEYSAALPP